MVDQSDGLADILVKDINTALARTHGRITWSPGWSRDSDLDPAVAVTGVRYGDQDSVALLRALRTVADRDSRDRAAVSDAPPASLRLPTLQSCAGWRTGSHRKGGCKGRGCRSPAISSLTAFGTLLTNHGWDGGSFSGCSSFVPVDTRGPVHGRAAE